MLRGTAPSVVVYSYAYLPLLGPLAAMSAGVRLPIAHAATTIWARERALRCWAARGLLLSLIATRVVTVSGPSRVGVSLKLGTVAVLVALFVVQGLVPPLAVAAVCAAVLARSSTPSACSSPKDEAA